MTHGPHDQQGIGTPSDDQPGFERPAGAPLGGHPTAPQPGQQAPSWQPKAQAWPPPPSTPQHWAPPDPRLVVQAPPSGRGPRHQQRRRVRMLAGVLAAALVVGILSSLPLLSPAPVAPTAAATPSAVVTVSPSARPGSASTATSGGDLGKAISFRSAAGSGTVTVTGVVWTDAGDMAAPAGRRYLVVDLTVACSQGSVPVDALMFLAVAGAERALPGFGPTLSSPLGGQVVKAGKAARGQVGYVLTPGPVSLNVLDADLRPVAELRIPAP